MNSNDRYETVEIIESLYWGRKIELDYETPFQLLCAVILSAQTTDKQVNKITPHFFAKVRFSKDVVAIPLEEIEEQLKYVNFFRNKSRFIKETWIILTEKHNGIIPNDLKWIQNFPGVGIKTAKVVLSVLYDMPYVGRYTYSQSTQSYRNSKNKNSRRDWQKNRCTFWRYNQTKNAPPPGSFWKISLYC